MQTFLPYPDYEESARALDYRRLGAQINEVQIIAGALLEIDEGFRNHAITKAWEGCTMQLVTFGLACEDEWERRGYKVRANRIKLEWMLTCAAEDENMGRPDWFGNPEVHAEYQGLLVWKDPTFYRPKFPHVQPISSDEFRYPTEF